MGPAPRSRHSLGMVGVVGRPQCKSKGRGSKAQQRPGTQGHSGAAAVVLSAVVWGGSRVAGVHVGRQQGGSSMGEGVDLWGVVSMTMYRASGRQWRG